MLSIHNGIAQGKITVKTAKDKTPLPSASVTFSTVDQVTHETFITDLDGNINIPQKFNKLSSFLITINYIGYISLTDTLKAYQNKTYFLALDVITINEVVITGQLKKTSANQSVHKVKIINRQQIEQQGAVSLKDALVNETNIRIAQDNVLGSSLKMQGISGQNIKILIDGVPVIGRLNGNVDVSQINLDNVERIEIIEGPLSVNYGTDALAGTINLITKKQPKDHYSATISSYYETVGQYNLTKELGWRGKNNSLSFSGGRNYFDGWSPNEEFQIIPKDFVANTTRFQSWKPKEQWFGRGHYIHYFKNNLKAIVSSSYFNENITNRGLPRGAYQETAFDDFYHTLRVDNSLTIDKEFTKKNDQNLNLIFAYNHFKRNKYTYYKDLRTLNQELTSPESQDTSVFNMYMARSTFSSKFSSKIAYQLGYDLRLEDSFGKRIKGGTQAIGDYAGFALVEYNPIKKLTIKNGVRYGYNTNYTHPLVPSINVLYKFKKISIRNSYARGFRSPSLKELHFDFVDINHNIQGNTNLGAETSNNYNASIDYQFEKGKQHFLTDVSIFYNDISNLITLVQADGSSFSYFNIEDYQTKGVQFNFRYSIKQLSWKIGGTYTGLYNTYSKTSNTSNFTYTPSLQSNIQYLFKKQKIDVALFYRYNGEVLGFYLDENEQIAQSKLGAYQTIDITVSKSFWKNRIKWILGVKNLLDVQNISMVGNTGTAHSSNSGFVPMNWGCSYFTSLKINLNESLFTKI